jgi:hypothetical protein
VREFRLDRRSRGLSGFRSLVLQIARGGDVGNGHGTAAHEDRVFRKK